MFTIVGGGFGLYGYLPGILQSYSASVILPEEYRLKVSKRPELNSYADRIQWCTSIDECFKKASAVVIASTPLKQPEIVCRVLQYANIKQIVLEKPLAVDPLSARNLLDQLEKSHAQVRINYSFPYCAWMENLDNEAIRKINTKINLTWAFFAHHFANNIQTWKSRHGEGGGVLRFYGIHLIALLAKLGYDSINISQLRGNDIQVPEQWNATFSSKRLPDFNIYLDSATTENKFIIKQFYKNDITMLLDLKTPFDLESAHENQDVRVGLLCELLSSFKRPDSDFYKWYEATNLLWSKVEAAMVEGE